MAPAVVKHMRAGKQIEVIQGGQSKPEQGRPEMYIERIMTGPVLAAKHLKANHPENRKIAPKWVNTLAGLLSNDQWEPDNGDTIKISVSGLLIDGQHRLKAIIKSGKTVLLTYAFNVPDSAFKTIDQGRKRTAVQSIKMTGRDISALEVAITRAILWEPDKVGGEAMTPVEIKTVYDIYESAIRTVAENYSETKKHAVMYAPIRAAAARALITGHDPESVTSFLTALDTGLAKCPLDAIAILLRNEFMSVATKGKSNTREGREALYAKALYALHCYLTNKQVSRLQHTKVQLFPL